jgi:hypothetical protein
VRHKNHSLKITKNENLKKIEVYFINQWYDNLNNPNIIINMTTRQRKQTVFFISEQPILMGKRVDGKRSNFHGWNDTYDRDFDGCMWIPSENHNNTTHLMNTSGYEKDDFIVENDDTILSDSEEELESDSEEELESDSEDEDEDEDEDDDEDEEEID